MIYQRYAFPNENFEHGCPHSYALLQFCLKLECYKPRVIEPNVTLLMISNYLRQYIAGYSVTNF